MGYTANSAILGQGTVSAEAIQAWFAARGKIAAQVFAPDKTYNPAPPTIGQDIIAVSAAWGVNHDLVAAQISKESAYWQSTIVRDKNNPSGLGAENDAAYEKAITFPTAYDGIRATVAHLLVYAVGNGAWTQYDPRYQNVKDAGWLGTAPTLKRLDGKWAYPGKGYGADIAARANDLVDFANNQTWEPPMAAQIPGFKWYPAQPTHYTKGRTVRIRGGAQHYSGGTNSLPWLTSTSGQDDPSRRVSATFLVKRNATMADRGWQLVRIEDTPWTTAYANPYTVSIEYEHLASQDIPDGDYEVLGQTWADIENYVLAQNLGTIDVVQGHKVWVDNPDLVCPDGIDVDRVVREWQARRGGGQPVRPPDVTDPDARYIEQTRVWLQRGFKAFWESNADALRWLGYPVENERGISGGLSIQRFQRGVLIYDASQPDGWQITALPLDRYAEFGLSEALAGRAA